MTFAEKVKFARSKLQISQEDLAKQIEVSRITVNRWESRELQPQFLTEQRFEAFCREHGINFNTETNK